MPSDPVKAADVVAQARKYVGTPFRTFGRARPENRKLHETIDCAGLLVCVAEDLGLRDRQGVPFLRSDYSDRGGAQHGKFMAQEFARRLEARSSGQPEPGDIVLLRAPNSISHCGFVGGVPGSLTLIFAYPVRMSGAVMGRIVEVRFDERWQGRLAAAFSFPGIADAAPAPPTDEKKD